MGKLRHEMPRLGSPRVQPAPADSVLQTRAGPARSPRMVHSSHPRPWHVCKLLQCLPKPKSSNHPTETLLLSATAVAPGPGGSVAAALQRQPWNFSQALDCPQKCHFLQECTKPGGCGSCSPRQPQLLPLPGAGASPARALAASPSCSHVPDFLPRGPPSSGRFFSRLSQHQAALRPCERQTGWGCSARAGRQPAAVQGSLCLSPPLKYSSIFFTPKKAWA